MPRSDYELSFALDVLVLIDRRLADLDFTGDPDTDGSFDHANYLAGVGFAVLQTYQTAASARLHVPKRRALSAGPKYKSELPIAALIDAVANHWKHSEEWDPSAVPDRARPVLDAFARLEVDPWGEYALANALWALVAPHPHRFSSLVPFVERWRDELEGTLA